MELLLPRDRAYYAVIDAEALVFTCGPRGRTINVVEQLAFVLYDANGQEAWAEKHMILQPHSIHELAAMYGADVAEVQRSADAYTRITGDCPVHANPCYHEKWASVRRHVLRALQFHAAVVYAKGPALESSILYGSVPIYDLALFGCPRYPLPIHDPLLECRFFAYYIPEIRAMAQERSWASFQ
jgi:hypothetical protein